MEDDKTTAAQYVRRFNEGYVIAKYMPELSENLATNNGQTAGLRAMQDGRNQYLSEKTKEKLPSWLSKDASKASKIPFGKGRDNPTEPER